MSVFSRRNFLKSAAAIPLVTSLSFAPRPASALALTTVAAGFSLAAGVLGFFGRSSDPTVPLLISLADAVDALGIKIDAIDEKLDILVEELASLRAQVSGLPDEIQLVQLTSMLREPWDAFVEASQGVDPINPSNTYLSRLGPTLQRLQVARRRFMRASVQGAESAFDGLVEIALAQDAEIAISSEMMSPFMFDRGEELDVITYRNALAVYRNYFEKALDPTNPQSIPSMKGHFERRILQAAGRQDDGTLGELEQAIRKNQSVKRQLQCTPLFHHCLQWITNGSGERIYCAEPGDRKGTPFDYNASVDIKQVSSFPVDLGYAQDTLDMPYFVEVGDHSRCPNRGSAGTFVSSPPVLTTLRNQIRDINQDIASYYRIHYVHEIALAALEINETIEADIAAMIDL